MLARARSELHGTVLDGRYRVLATIGKGGSGAVLEAERLSDRKLVALKVLQPEAARSTDFVRRLRSEAEIGRVLRHPGILRCIDEGTLTDGSPYVVMDRLDGESLSSLLWRLGPLQVQDACLIGARIASALHTVHAHGYVHRDVKTEHIWLSRTAQGALAVHLLDFGVCLPPASTGRVPAQPGELFGTPGYMSPEQARGDDAIDGLSDLFALGVVLFEALTGELPFSGPNIAVLLRRVIEERAPHVGLLRRDVPQELAQCIMRLLDPDSKARLPNARAAERALLAHAALTQPTERMLAARLHRLDDVDSAERAPEASPTHNLALVAT